jgi:hypothetical protein
VATRKTVSATADADSATQKPNAAVTLIKGALFIVFSPKVNIFCSYLFFI